MGVSVVTGVSVDAERSWLSSGVARSRSGNSTGQEAKRRHFLNILAVEGLHCCRWTNYYLHRSRGHSVLDVRTRREINKLMGIRQCFLHWRIR